MTGNRTPPIVLVATPGGHLHELFELARRLPAGQPRVWLTARTAQSVSLLEGQPTVFIPKVGARQAGRALASLPRAVSLMRRIRPSAVISTGAALCLPYLMAALLHRVDTHYIESVTRTDQPSLTGKILAQTPGARLHHQGLESPGDKWSFVGSSLDRFTTLPAARDRGIKRVLVTVGGERFPFTRLIDTVRAALPPDVDVVWQTGHTEVPPGLPGRVQPWLSYEEMVREIDRADAVVSHAGVGSVLSCLSRGVMPVVLARSSARGEHVDEHQESLNQQLRQRVLAVDLSKQEAWAALREAASYRVTAQVPPPLDLLKRA